MCIKCKNSDPIMKNYSFNKHEKLKSKKEIAKLFKGSINVYCFPIKALYSVENQDAGIKIALTVSKRNFNRAVDRNKIKRKMREAYRLNKLHAEDLVLEGLSIIFIYVAKNKEEYAVIEEGMKKVLEKIKIGLKQE